MNSKARFYTKCGSALAMIVYACVLNVWRHARGKIDSWVAVKGEGGVAGEGRVVSLPKFHSWGKCTMPSTNINSDWMSNASSVLCIMLFMLCYLCYLYYAGPLSCILGCNITRVLYFASWGVVTRVLYFASWGCNYLRGSFISHLVGRCTIAVIALTNMHSDSRFNPSSGLCIML